MTILVAKNTAPREGGPSFTRSNRLLRVLWQLVWGIFASWTPPALMPWRRAILRLFGANIDPTAQVYGSVRIWHPAHLAMAAHACLGPEVICYSMAKISLGAYALVSQRAHLCAGTHDIEDEHFQLHAEPIVLSAHCWVAAEAFVGPGVSVGEGAVLGARAVAFRDLPPWSVSVGNPARVVKMRKNPFPGERSDG